MSQPDPAGGQETRWLNTRRIRRIVFFLCLGPLVYLGASAGLGKLGANPIEEVLNQLGWWALLMLLASLVCTPLKILFHWNWPQRVRKMLGLSAFFYASAHLLTYVVLDQGLDFAAIWEDIIKRNFILVGSLTYIVLTPLAITSRKSITRRMGPVRWGRLHRLVYVAAIFGVVHFIWRVKADLREPLIFAGVLAVLLGVRVVAFVKNRVRPSTA